MVTTAGTLNDDDSLAVPRRAARALMVSRDDQIRLQRIQSWRWLLALAFDWGVIVAAVWSFSLLRNSVWMAPLTVLIISARLNGLAVLAHDACHLSAFANRRLNDWMVNVFVMWPIMLDIAGYRPWHFQHHRHVGTDRDSELPLLRSSLFRAPVRFARIVACFVGDWFGLGLPTVLAFVRAVGPKRWTRFIGPGVMWATFVAVVVRLDAIWIPLLWLYCAVFGFFVVARIRTWTEHIAVDADSFPSRRFRPGFVARFFFFPHDSWCHYEHHLFPRVPFYNLQKLRALEPAANVISACELFWNYARYSGASLTRA